MIIDGIFIFICLVFALFGLKNGAIHLVFRVVDLIAGYFAADWIAPVIAEYVQEDMDIEATYAASILFFICWGFLYFLIAETGSMLTEGIEDLSEGAYRADKIFGFLLGLVQGAIIFLIVIQGLAIVKDTIYKVRPEAVEWVKASRVLTMMTDLNESDWSVPDDLMNLSDKLEGLDPSKYLNEEESKAEGGKKDVKKKGKSTKKKRKVSAECEKSLEWLEENTWAKSILEDPKLLEQLRARDWESAMKDKRVKKLLSKPKRLQEFLGEIGNLLDPECNPPAKK